MTNWIEKITGDLEQKKRYRDYKRRVHALPEGYRQGAAALERYLMHLGPTSDGESLITMLGDLADLLEQHAAVGTPLREVVGAEPVEFIETFMQNYPGGSWIRSEQQRLSRAIDAAAGDTDDGGRS